MKILHGFADTGVESYILSDYGTVTRLGINPDTGLRDIDNFEGAKEIIRGDGVQTPFCDNAFDLAFIHPPCTPDSKLTNINVGKYDDYEKPQSLIKPARKEVKRIAKDYVIENLPRSDIRSDIILKGPMFDIEYRKERGFETTFPVKEPPQMPENYRYTCEMKTSKYYVMREKGYPDLWSGKEAKNASIPAPYVRHILDSYVSNR